MKRFLFYIFVISILIFTSFEISSDSKNVIVLPKRSSINVSLVASSKNIKKIITEEVQHKETMIEQKPLKKKKIALKKKKSLKRESTPIKKEIQQITKAQVKPLAEKKTQQTTTNEIKVEEQEIKETFVLNTTNNNTDIADKYYAEIYELIDRNKRYPKKAIQFKQEGAIKVFFIILEDGTVTDFKIVESSKFKILNKEVRRMFKKIKKFKSVPRELTIPLEVNIAIDFKMK